MSTTMSDENLRYVERWFWSLEALAQAVGIDGAEVAALISAGCAPGPIYAFSAQTGWWSALDDAHPPTNAIRWFSPAAAWGLRRAVLLQRQGRSAQEAAAELLTVFKREFVSALERTPRAELAFPGCFVDGDLDEEAAAVAAAREWDDWLQGGYGVCLKVFTAQTCVTKEAIGSSIKRQLEAGCSPESQLDDAEALSVVTLPFAPWQRMTGTPGRTIDRVLAEAHLGDDRPYAP